MNMIKHGLIWPMKVHWQVMIKNDQLWSRMVTHGQYGPRICSSDKLDDGMSGIVTYSTRCTEWTYMAKKVGLKLFCISCYGPVWLIIAIFAPLLPITPYYGNICQVLPYVAQYAKNGQTFLKMAHKGTVCPVTNDACLSQYCQFLPILPVCVKFDIVWLTMINIVK
jgi:hypothetical protein